MTNKIMMMADTYANRAAAHQVHAKERAALAAAIQSEQDYTRALRSELEDTKALLHQALDERDHYLRERDALRAAPVQPLTCDTCTHFKHGKQPGIKIYDMSCLECSQYYANRHEAHGITKELGQ
jgi:hypothetical protein